MTVQFLDFGRNGSVPPERGGMASATGASARQVSGAGDLLEAMAETVRRAERLSAFTDEDRHALWSGAMRIAEVLVLFLRGRAPEGDRALFVALPAYDGKTLVHVYLVQGPPERFVTPTACAVQEACQGAITVLRPSFARGRQRPELLWREDVLVPLWQAALLQALQRVGFRVAFDYEPALEPFERLRRALERER